jgi:hypothetical protein
MFESLPLANAVVAPEGLLSNEDWQARPSKRNRPIKHFFDALTGKLFKEKHVIYRSKGGPGGRMTLVYSEKKLVSSNEIMLLQECETPYTVFSVVLNVLQLVTIFLVMINIQAIRSELNYWDRIALIVVFYPFVSIYSGSLVASSLSENVIRSFSKDYLSNGKLVATALKSRIMNTILIPPKLFKKVVKSTIKLIFLQDVRESWAVAQEILLVLITSYCVVKIAVTQPDFISILFNFAGILIILGIDDSIIGYLEITVPMVCLVYANSEGFRFYETFRREFLLNVMVAFSVGIYLLMLLYEFHFPRLLIYLAIGTCGLMVIEFRLELVYLLNKFANSCL